MWAYSAHIGNGLCNGDRDLVFEADRVKVRTMSTFRRDSVQFEFRFKVSNYMIILGNMPVTTSISCCEICLCRIHVFHLMHIHVPHANHTRSCPIHCFQVRDPTFEQLS